jgi:hypothetical protein
MGSDVHASAAIRKPGTRSKGATSETHRLDKLTDPGPIAGAKTEMEFVTQGLLKSSQLDLLYDVLMWKLLYGYFLYKYQWFPFFPKDYFLDDMATRRHR